MPRRGLPGPFLERVAPPTLEAVAAAAERLENWALAVRVRFERRRELLLIYDELATNVAKYATGATELAIGVAREETGGLLLTLEDDGPAYDPFARPDPDTTLPLELREPGGLGVHLVRQLAAAAGYRRIGERNRVEVRLAP